MNLEPARTHLAIATANACRVRGDRSSPAERLVDELFAANEKLVTYGTLMPGERNHDVVRLVGGTWRRCQVRGTLHPTGWGAVEGFPAIRLDPTAPAVDAMLLECAALRDHWARLDRFEGEEYLRVLVPVHDGREILAIANIYEAREIPGR